jgi:hypothetical protein
VSPVALVPPVVVSLVVDMLAVLRVVAVSPVLAMRRFSFVPEGVSSSNGTKQAGVACVVPNLNGVTQSVGGCGCLDP